MAERKRTNSDLQNTTQIIAKDQAMQTHTKTGMNSCASEGLVVPVTPATPVLLLLNDTYIKLPKTYRYLENSSFNSSPPI